MRYSRLAVFFCFFIALFSVVQLRLFVLAGDDTVKAAAGKQGVVQLALPALRPNFYDCMGNLLTGAASSCMVAAGPGAASYGALYPVTAVEDKAALYAGVTGHGPFLCRVQAVPEGFTGYTCPVRYAALPAAVHTIGYVNGDGVGVSGLERALEGYLNQETVVRTLACPTDATGSLVENAQPILVCTDNGGNILSGAEGGTGAGVVLTLDMRVQRACEAIAAGQISAGAILVQQIDTGELRAVVSTPAFDPNRVADSLNDEAGPLVNRALCAYNVGSVFKPMAAAAALSAGADPAAEYYCTGEITVDGHTYHCAGARAHGMVNMALALERSCNCYFIHLAGEIGPGAAYGLSIACGLGRPTALAPGYQGAAGSLPTLAQLANSGERSGFAFGQGRLLATPLQLMGCYTMLARGGRFVGPSLVGATLQQGTALPWDSGGELEVLPGWCADAVAQMLAGVVENGGGKRAKPALYTAAGKTGTAQTGRVGPDGEEQYIAWFAGWYPAARPQYTVVVCIEDGGESGETAAPVFARVCDALEELGLIVPPS